MVGAVSVLTPPVAGAQDSHWGVTASFVPKWKPVPEIYDLIWDVENLQPESRREFRIGIVRGSDRGGDWSVTFVRNSFRTSQVYEDTFGSVGFTDQTGKQQIVDVAGSIRTFPGTIEHIGVKFEKFTPFVTIRDRVQVGLTYGGGIGSLRGTVVERAYEIPVTFPPPSFRPVVGARRETTSSIEVKELYTPSFVPIGSVEAAVAIILAPGIKARVTGGFNYPNTQVFSLTFHYLIGS
jgi:hypothetical protein